MTIKSANGLLRPSMIYVEIDTSDDAVNSEFVKNMFPYMPTTTDWSEHKEYAERRRKYVHALDLISYFLHLKFHWPCFKLLS